MDAIEHTAQIQYLLRQFRGPEASDAPTKFLRFMYFQSYPKIQKIISNPLRLLFTEGTISDEDLRLGMGTREINKFVTHKMLRHGDGWIKDIWVCSIKKAPVLKKLDGRKVLVYSGTSAVQLHRLICHIFNLLSHELDNIGHAWEVHHTPEIINDNYIEVLQGALYGVEYYLDFFDSLLKSPCLWKHMQHPVIHEWMYNQYCDSEVWLAPSTSLYWNSRLMLYH